MILLVENDAFTRGALAAHLRDSGYSILEAANAHDAMAVIISGNRVRLIIVDFVLPDMDGAEFIERIRELLPNIPLILMSGYLHHGAAETILAKFSTGAKYLPKPVRPTALELTVQTLLS